MQLMRRLDDILAAPANVGGLSQAELAALLLQIASHLLAVGAKDHGQEGNGSTPADEVYLTADEAALRIRKSRRWIYRNAARLPFVRRISRRSLLCSPAGITKWLERQKA